MVNYKLIRGAYFYQKRKEVLFNLVNKLLFFGGGSYE